MSFRRSPSPAYAASVALALSPLGHVSARTEMAPAPGGHGKWTLKQREDRVNDRLEQAGADGSLHEDEYDRAKQDVAEMQHQEYTMREAGQGQLTDNQTNSRRRWRAWPPRSTGPTWPPTRGPGSGVIYA
jgi:hypothetical protein